MVADVGAARAAGTEVILRSNLTIRNTLHVKVHVLFEELYPSADDDEDTRVYEVCLVSRFLHRHCAELLYIVLTKRWAKFAIHRCYSQVGRFTYRFT